MMIHKMIYLSYMYVYMDFIYMDTRYIHNLDLVYHVRVNTRCIARSGEIFILFKLLCNSRGDGISEHDATYTYIKRSCFNLSQ